MKDKRRKHRERQKKRIKMKIREGEIEKDKKFFLTRVEVETVIGVNILEKKKIQ